MNAILARWSLLVLAALAAGFGPASAGAEECLSAPALRAVREAVDTAPAGAKGGTSVGGCAWERLPTQSYCSERVRGVGPLRDASRCGALRADGEREVFVLRTAAGKTYLPPNSSVIVEQGAGSNVFWALRTGAGEAVDVGRLLERPDRIPRLAIGGAGVPRGDLKTLGGRTGVSGAEGGESQRTSLKP